VRDAARLRPGPEPQHGRDAERWAEREPKANPIERAQVPETAMAAAVVRVRPQRSPRTPPR